MPGIVSAVRGGPGSRPTIERAIQLAKDSGQELYFIYIVNVDFLSHTAISRVQALIEELTEMGEFILLHARETALSQGVTAQGVVRRGNVRQEITKLCHELDASYLVLGRPAGGEKKDTFDTEAIANFQETIERETGARVIFAGGESP
jgi:nucleotide-binding universal stress UspA family protein